MELDTTLLKQALFYIVTGGGSMVVAYWLMENLPPLAGLSSKGKRYASLAIAAVLAGLAYGLAVAMNYTEAPATTQAWIEALFAVAFVAVTGSQALHGARKL